MSTARSKPWLRALAGTVAAALIGTGIAVASLPPAVAAPGPSGTPTRVGAVGYDSMVIKWNPVDGAAGYQVQWSSSSTFSKYLKSLDVTDPTKTSALLTGMSGDVTYYYRVRAYDFKAATPGPTSDWSARGYSKTKYSTTRRTSAIAITNVAGTSIEFNWANIGGSVSGYQTKAVASGKPTVYASTTSTGITIKGLVKSTYYKLYIAAAETVDTSVVFVRPGGPNSVRTGPFTTGKSVKTSSYPLAAPADLTAKNATPYTVDLSWTPPTGIATYPGAKYRIDYALDSAIKEGATYQVVDGPTSTTLGSLKPLKENTQYYVRIRVVDADGVTIRSDRSDYVLAKTRIPYGTVNVKVNGAPARDVVVAAFKGNDLINQVEASGDGNHKLKLRPGTYRIKAIYVGAGNYTSLWSWSGQPGGRFLEESSVITVEKDGTHTAPAITLARGGVLSGTVSVSGKGGYAGVDVTVMSNEAGGGSEVAGMDRTATGGAYQVTGLPDGAYKVRYRLSGHGIKTEYFTISGGSTKTQNVTLAPH